jgi:ribose transport system permease protein
VRRHIGQLRVTASLIPLAIAIAVFGANSETFLRWDNFALILSTCAFVGIVAVGQTLLIISGEFDLSVGAVAALSGYVSARLMAHGGWPIPLGLLAGLGIGCVAGFANGLLVTKFGVSSFIATIGMLYIARGLGEYLSHGESVFPIPHELTSAGLETLSGVALGFFAFLVLVVLAELTLRRTVPGRAMLATGSNEETARVIGINTKRVKMAAFVCVGALAAVAGMLQMITLGSGDPSAGIGWELTSVAAVVIGGTSLFGGSGSAFGTLIGVVTLQVISNGIVAVGLETNLQTIATGALMVLIVALDMVWRRGVLR